MVFDGEEMDRFTFATALALGIMTAGSVSAGSYKFHVRCTDGHEVVVRIGHGDIDPGREVARAWTGYQQGQVHKECNVNDFRKEEHNHLPVEELSYNSVDSETLARAIAGDPEAILQVVVGVPATVAGDVVNGPGKNNDLVGKNGFVRRVLGF